MQDSMLEEAIYKFKVSGPTIMPALFDNYFLKETEECNGYAILTYEGSHHCYQSYKSYRLAIWRNKKETGTLMSVSPKQSCLSFIISSRSS